MTRQAAFLFVLVNLWLGAGARAEIPCDPAGAPFGGGDGTSANPYLVCTVEQFRSIGGSGRHYRLESDLDFSGIAYEPVPLDGWFNGGNHTIANVTVDRPSEADLGVFGRAHNAHISHLRLFNVSITGGNRVGGLIGRSTYGSLHNVHARRVTLRGYGAVGGLQGSGQYLSVSDSSVTELTLDGHDGLGGIVGVVTGSYRTLWAITAKGVITNFFDPAKPGMVYTIGGLVGNLSYGSTLRDAYSQVEIRGGCGLVGFANSYVTLRRSYATGRAWSPILCKPYNSRYLTVDKTVYDYQTTGGSQWGSWGASAMTTAQMRQPAYPITTWDFNGQWKMPACGGYPLLRFEADESCGE